MNGSPYRDVLLPESVESMIERICLEKEQKSLKPYARQMLDKIGEQASVEVLTKILSGGAIRKSFSGFVAFLVKKTYPLQAEAVLSAGRSSPASPQTQRMWSPSSTSPCTSPYRMNGESFQSSLSSSSVNPTPSNLERRPQNVSRHLSFEDETPDKRSSSVGHHTSQADELRGIRGLKTVSEQLMILSKLEFKKLFLVLSYVGRQKMEVVVTPDGAEEIYSMKDLPMRTFENRIWTTYGQKFCEESDRSHYLNWDSGKTHLYYCHVCPDGSYYFKGPYMNSTRTHLQRSLGDDNVLIVKFSEDGSYDKGNIAEEGILVGLRRYRFFVSKDERKKVKKKQMEKEKNAICSAVKCYFVRIGPSSPYDCDQNYILSQKSINEARRMFMHIHTLSTLEKYMARFSLILSKTIRLAVDFAAIIVKRIEDIPFQDENENIVYDGDGKPILHTDGTGYISEDLAMKCPKDFSVAKYITDNCFEKYDQFVDSEGMACQERAEARNKEPPLLMQCRLFHDGYAVKGTLLLNRKLEPGTIQVRPSMIKVERDQRLPTEETFNSLEIVAISHRPGRASLSRYLIALLRYGGVPDDFFLNLLKSTLEETRNVYSNTRAALRVAFNHDGLDYAFLAQRMICCGIPLNEPFLHHCLSNLENGGKTRLKEGKIPLSESYYLMGTADPTGVLEYDQVCVILDNGQISGDVLVYRNPGMHFGDVHVMKAVFVDKLVEVVGNAKYGIFFSTKGWRSAAYEMATGDFDGDRYLVSRNPELLEHFKASDPWERGNSIPASKMINPQELSESELERELYRVFLESRNPSFSMGIAADSLLSFMDRLLTLDDRLVKEKQIMKRKMIELIDIYYEALDAPKTGKKVIVPDELRAEKYPHYMERGSTYTFDSSSVLGKIYDTVKAFKNEAAPEIEIWKLPSFDVQIPDIYVSKWRERYDDYRKEMSEALKSSDESKNDAANDVIKKYKQMLYGAPEWEESTKDDEVIYEEAIAIYHVSYDYAMSLGDQENHVAKCGFAWKVAGSALCNLYAWKLEGAKNRPITILPSVLREFLK